MMPQERQLVNAEYRFFATISVIRQWIISKLCVTLVPLLCHHVSTEERVRGIGGYAMTSTSIAKRISPMLVTADMEETILFYQSVLGFKPTMKSAGYSIVERDGQTIHFQKAASEEVMKCVRGHTEIYIEVSGIHILWEHVKTFKN